MQIDELSYLEDISQMSTIFGGVTVDVTATALASGDTASTFTDAFARAKSFRNGAAVGIGRGTAIAIGSYTFANVDVSGSGDKVIEKTKVKYFRNKDMTIARGFVIAIDRP